MSANYDYSGQWQMTYIGPGPGPKNVLAERVGDGTRVVVPYAVWKYRLLKEEHMAERRGSRRGSSRRSKSSGDKQYAHFIGLVAFDPNEDEANGKDVVRAGIQVGTKIVSATFWESGDDLERGDVVSVRGTVTTKKAKNKKGVQTTYTNMDVYAYEVTGSLPFDDDGGSKTRDDDDDDDDDGDDDGDDDDDF